MSWISEHRNVWRVAILVVVVVAIMGPWMLDRVLVPSEFACSAPSFRLDDSFCGSALPGTWLLSTMVDVFVYGSAELVKGGMAFGEWARAFLFGLTIFLLVLPFFSTLLLVLRGDRWRRQVFNTVAWGLGAGVGLLIGISNHPRLFLVLWGSWLYIGLAASALILEVRTLRAGRTPSQE